MQGHVQQLVVIFIWAYAKREAQSRFFLGRPPLPPFLSKD